VITSDITIFGAFGDCPLWIGSHSTWNRSGVKPYVTKALLRDERTKFRITTVRLSIGDLDRSSSRNVKASGLLCLSGLGRYTLAFEDSS